MTDDEEVSRLKQQLEQSIEEASNLISTLREASADQSEKIAELAEAVSKASTNVEETASSRGSAETNAEAIEGLLEQARANQKPISSLSSQAGDLEETIRVKGDILDAVTERAKELAGTIETLLPGATSAGLASAFKDRKESFRLPKIAWAFAFVLSMVAFAIVSFFDPITLERADVSLSTFLPYLLVRLPFYVPIVWLALYSGRRHEQALRLEEEYAHKETLSNSFEGYRKRLAEIESSEESAEKKSALNLFTTTLEAIAVHPGRVYLGKPSDISPWHSMMDSLKRDKKNGGEDGGSG